MSDANDPSSSQGLTDLPGSLADFAEIAFDAVVAFNSQEQITYWNPAAEQMFGWTAQEAFGKTPAKLSWYTNLPDEERSSLKRGEVLRGEKKLSCKNGSVLYVQYARHAVFDATGKVSGYLAIYNDISVQEQNAIEKKQREESLRARTEEIETLLQVSPVAIFVAHDPECTRITGNPAGYQMVALSEDANISKSAPAPERPTYRTFRKGVEVLAQDLPMQKAARLGVEVNEEELELRFADGSQKFIYAFAKPLFDPQGRPRGAVAAMLDITARKRAEEERQESQQMLETIVNQMPAAVALIRGSDLRLQLINRAYQAIAPGKEMTGHTLDELWPETEQNFAAICRRVLETGEPYQVVDELNMIRRQPDEPPEPAYFSWALYRVHLPGDRGWGLLNTSEETTTRKQAEEALRESEERLRQMVATSLVAIGFGDSTGKIFDANESFYRLTGYTREELHSRQLGWDQLTAPEYAELDRQMIATLAATGSAGPYEKEYIRKDGSRIPLLLTMSKLPGRDEHIAFILDITERKCAEQSLAQTMQELHAHINNSPLAIVSFDSELRITEWSAGAERMFGWRADEVLNKTIAELRWVPEEDVQRVADLSVDMFAGRTSSNVHANRNYRKDGSVIECEWYNSALLDAHGKLISVRSQVLDMTERKHAEEALRENQKQLQLLNETLEQQVHEKTAEVRHLTSDLIKAVQQERHRISHILHDDLQQRIYAIRMQLTFLHDHLPQDNEIAQKDESDIERQLDEILMVTRNLSIDLSPPILRDEGLSHAINWLAARMRQRYSLPIEIQANGVFALADEELHVLLFNCVRELLFNVVKHAQASRAVVTLLWIDGGLQIEVRDDGKGFTITEQSNREMSEDIEGQVSSGLHTIRHQLSLFGGQMEIQSEPGAGTQINLIIPIPKAE
jgi:PAS domain S-box-containing protein